MWKLEFTAVGEIIKVRRSDWAPGVFATVNRYAFMEIARFCTLFKIQMDDLDLLKHTADKLKKSGW